MAKKKVREPFVLASFIPKGKGNAQTARAIRARVIKKLGDTDEIRKSFSRQLRRYKKESNKLRMSGDGAATVYWY